MTTANYGDPDASGQDIAFQYQGFTIQACWRDTALARPDACLPQQGVSTFRTVRNGTADTRFTVSTKNLADLPAEAGPIVRFFETAELAVRPSWLPDYVAREFAKLVGE